MKNTIAIIYGGYSSESAISKKSAQTIFENIDTTLFIPKLVEINQTAWSVITNNSKLPIDKNDFSYSVNGKTNKFDIAFITIHGTPGEDGKLPAYFDLIGLPYVNSNCLSASLSFNKWACNSFLNSFGVNTAKSILLRKGENVNPKEIADTLKFPCFVKPNDGGSSFGISKVSNQNEIIQAVERAFEEGAEVIIEAFLAGREFTCGLYKVGNTITALPPTEIISENDFFDYEAKYQGKSREVTPADLPAEKTMEMQNIAKKAFHKLGLSAIARIDFMMHPDGTLNIIEVNTNPGMTGESIIPQQVEAAGKKLSELFTSIIEGAI